MAGIISQLDGNPYDEHLRFIRSRESRGRNIPNARGSGAFGPYQFMEPTWQGLVRQGTQFQGRPITAEDRYNPDVQEEVMQRQIMPQYFNTWQREFGRTPRPHESYAMHWWGPTGGARFARMAQANPDAPVSDFVDATFSERLRPRVYEQNPSLMENGRPRTMAGVMRQIMDGASATGPSGRPGPPVNPNDPTAPPTTPGMLQDVAQMRRMIMANLPSPEARAAAMDRFNQATERLSGTYANRRMETQGFDVPLIAAGAQMMQSTNRGLLPVIGEGFGAFGRTLGGMREADRQDQIRADTVDQEASRFGVTEMDRLWTQGMGSLNNAIQLGRLQVVQDRLGGVSLIDPLSGNVQVIQSRPTSITAADEAEATRQVDTQLAGLPEGYWNQPGMGGVEGRNAWREQRRQEVLADIVNRRAAVAGTAPGVGVGQVAAPAASAPGMGPPGRVIPGPVAPTNPALAPQPGQGVAPLPAVPVRPIVPPQGPDGASPPSAMPAPPPGIPSPGPAAGAPAPPIAVPVPAAPGGGGGTPGMPAEITAPPGMPIPGPPVPESDAPGTAPPVPAVTRPQSGAPAARQPTRVESQSDVERRNAALQPLQAEFAASQQHATRARATRTQIDAMDGLLDQYRTGPTARVRNQISQVMSEILGRPFNLTGDPSIGTLITNLQNQFLPAVREGLFQRVTNYDLYTMQQMVPAMHHSTYGNRAILDYMRYMADSAEAYGEAYRQNAARHNGSVGPDIDEDLRVAVEPIQQRYIQRAREMTGGQRGDREQGNRFLRQLEERRGRAKGGRAGG